MAEKCKPYEIYWRLCDVYGEACFSKKKKKKEKRKKDVYKGVNLGLSIQAWVLYI